jgi:ZIP family zinc transporter
MWTALLLALGAGLSTMIGSLIGLVMRNPGPKFISFTVGFSAGIMIFISFGELLPGAIAIEGAGFLKAHAAFFSGMAGYFLIDLLVPHDYLGQHDHGHGKHEPLPPNTHHTMERTGVLVALGLSIHNIPEGMAIFVAGLKDIHLGFAIAAAIAVHNIPLGLAISAPIYNATASMRKAFLWSFFSGLSGIIGACLAAIVLMPFLSDTVMGFVFAVVGGIMVVIAIDELVPAAKELSSEHTPIVGVIAGMIVTMISLWLLE